MITPTNSDDFLFSCYFRAERAKKSRMYENMRHLADDALLDEKSALQSSD